MDLVEQIRDRVRCGRVPLADGCQVFGVKGDGSACACCDRPISAAEIQFDVEYRASASAWSTFPMHLHCFQTWRSASIRLKPPPLDSRVEQALRSGERP